MNKKSFNPKLLNYSIVTKFLQKKLKIISIIGVLILIGQGTLSFSDIDQSGWLLVVLYILFVLIYIKLRQPYIKKTDS